MLNAILEFCESQRDWAVETIDTLARLESPTLDKRAVDVCGQELRRRLAAMGGRGEQLPREQTGDHLLVEFGSGTRQVLILGHFDTVWPVGQIGRLPIRSENGRLYGPGVFDMKGGIAIGMLATRALCEVGPPLRRRVVMLWTADEERGSVSSREVIAEQARRSDAVLVLEPSGPGGALQPATRRRIQSLVGRPSKWYVLACDHQGPCPRGASYRRRTDGSARGDGTGASAA